MKKLLNFISGLILTALFGIGTYYCYNSLIETHELYCCENLSNCPLYVCTYGADKFNEYTLLAMATVFCGLSVIAVFIGTIKNLFSKNK